MSKLEKDPVSSRLDDIKARRPGVTIRFWIDSKPVPVEERDCEYVGKDDLDWLIAEVERLTAERDVIRGIVGHPGTNVLPEDAALSEVVRVSHHAWLASQQASNQRILAEQGRADRAESERDAARAEGARPPDWCPSTTVKEENNAR